MSPQPENKVNITGLSNLGVFLYGYMENKMYRISCFKHRGIYLIMALLCAAFISRIKVEENEIMCHFKAIRHFLTL